MTLRLATPDDVPAIRRIVDAAYSPYIPLIGHPPGPMTDDYAALVAEGRVRVTEGPEPMGILVLLPQPDHMLLDNIAIAPEAQGQGLGRILMAEAEALTRAAGYDEIRLYTNAIMTRNIEIYARAGYVETHRAVEKGFNRVYMAKPLG